MSGKERRMGKIILETDRLFLREMDERDLKDLSEILQDPEVMYAYEHEFTDQDVRDWLNRQKNRYERYGYGLWAAVLKETGEMVGQAGLTIQDCEGEKVLEIGYLLKKKYWHRGYAREAALGCREYAFGKLRASRVCSVIKIDNAASIRVAGAIGMKKEKEFLAQYYSGKKKHYLFSCKAGKLTEL